jgi:hypothetical protein
VDAIGTSYLIHVHTHTCLHTHTPPPFLLYRYGAQSPPKQCLMPDTMVGVAVGIFPFRTSMAKKGMRMGYVEVETREACPLFPAGLKARGHVFHFSQILEEKIVGGFGRDASATGYQMGYSATMQVEAPCHYSSNKSLTNHPPSRTHIHTQCTFRLMQLLRAKVTRGCFGSRAATDQVQGGICGMCLRVSVSIEGGCEQDRAQNKSLCKMLTPNRWLVLAFAS